MAAEKNKEKVVLAYSGGLDTSVMVKWLQLEKNLDVVAICGNVGQDAQDLTWVEKKALGILYGGAYGKEEGGEDVLLLFNFYYGEETFALPTLPGGRTWYFVNNTASYDFNAGGLLLENQQNAIVPGGTVTVLIGKSADDE